MCPYCKKKLTRTQKLLYRVKSGYFATQLKPAVERVLSFLGLGIRWAWSIWYLAIGSTSFTFPLLICGT
ncbi:hypothetical protein PU45_09530 [Escherichia coli]|nr:hypothetical protein PU45_09530 [Escherichia coli]RFA76540.1 hypothetical protein CA895_06870 [Escherichia coli]